MAERSVPSTWIGRGSFAALCLAIIFAMLLPLDMQPNRWAAHDVLLATILAWVIRRPEYASAVLLAVILLLTDLLFQRPPGLYAAVALVVTEMIRKRGGRMRQMPFLVEWGTAALGIVAITLINRMALVVFMTPQPPLGMSLIQMAMTILVYPVVIGVAVSLFGLRRRSPGETNAAGQRL